MESAWSDSVTSFYITEKLVLAVKTPNTQYTTYIFINLYMHVFEI